MAKATRSLSPKLALERMQRHRHAVILLALQRCKRSVQARIRAKGFRLCEFTAKSLSWPRLSLNVIASGSSLKLSRRSTRGQASSVGAYRLGTRCS